MALSGPGYLLKGFGLLGRPGIRRFVVAPVCINLLLFIGLTFLLVQQYSALLNWLMSYVPDWLDWLVWVLWLLFGLVLMIAYGYSFTLVSNLLASPFYGLLAERVQKTLSGPLDETPLTLKTALAIAWRSFRRELRKLAYFLPRILLVVIATLILSFIPLLDLAAPLVAFLWGAWSLALQYLDYPADNNRVSFDGMRVKLRKKRGLSLTFGGATLALATLPIVNLVAMPAAVAGATLLWLDQFADDETS